MLLKQFDGCILMDTLFKEFLSNSVNPTPFRAHTPISSLFDMSRIILENKNKLSESENKR